MGSPWLTYSLYANRPKPENSHWPLAIGVGLLGAITLLGLITLLGHPIITPATHLTVPAPWQGMLASFYGGIVEEIQLRLFLLTLIAWLLTRLHVSRPLALGIAIVAAALLFGAGHLPLAAKLTTLDAAAIARVVGYNALLGLGFGWLYCKRGIEHAMIAHFCADFVLHVAAPALA